MARTVRRRAPTPDTTPPAAATGPSVQGAATAVMADVSTLLDDDATRAADALRLDAPLAARRAALARLVAEGKVDATFAAPLQQPSDAAAAARERAASDTVRTLLFAEGLAETPAARDLSRCVWVPLPRCDGERGEPRDPDAAYAADPTNFLQVVSLADPGGGGAVTCYNVCDLMAYITKSLLLAGMHEHEAVTAALARLPRAVVATAVTHPLAGQATTDGAHVYAPHMSADEVAHVAAWHAAYRNVAALIRSGVLTPPQLAAMATVGMRMAPAQSRGLLQRAADAVRDAASAVATRLSWLMDAQFMLAVATVVRMFVCALVQMVLVYTELRRNPRAVAELLARRADDIAAAAAALPLGGAAAATLARTLRAAAERATDGSGGAAALGDVAALVAMVALGDWLSASAALLRALFAATPLAARGVTALLRAVGLGFLTPLVDEVDSLLRRVLPAAAALQSSVGAAVATAVGGPVVWLATNGTSLLISAVAAKLPAVGAALAQVLAAKAAVDGGFDVRALLAGDPSQLGLLVDLLNPTLVCRMLAAMTSDDSAVTRGCDAVAAALARVTTWAKVADLVKDSVRDVLLAWHAARSGRAAPALMQSSCARNTYDALTAAAATVGSQDAGAWSPVLALGQASPRRSPSKSPRRSPSKSSRATPSSSRALVVARTTPSSSRATPSSSRATPSSSRALVVARTAANAAAENAAAAERQVVAATDAVKRAATPVAREAAMARLDHAHHALMEAAAKQARAMVDAAALDATALVSRFGDGATALAVVPGDAARRRAAALDAMERRPARAPASYGTTFVEREAAYAAREAAKDAERGLVPIPGMGAVDLSSPLRAAEAARRREAMVDALERQPSRALTAPGTTRAEREAAYAAKEAAKDAERGLTTIAGMGAVDLSSPLRAAEATRRREAMVDALERQPARALAAPGTTRAEREAAYASREAAKDAERGLAVLPGEVAVDLSSPLRAAEAARRREAMVDALERQPSRALAVPGTTRAEREAAYAAREAAKDAERGLAVLPGEVAVDLSSPLRAAEAARRREAMVDALERQPSRALAVPGTTRAEREAAYAAREAAKDAERGLVPIAGKEAVDLSSPLRAAELARRREAMVDALERQPSRALAVPGTTRAEREAAYAAREAAKDAERGLAVLPGEMAVDLSSPLRVAELARRREAMVDALERQSSRALTAPGTTRAEREAAYAAREAAKDAERGLVPIAGKEAVDLSSPLRAAEAARRREAMVDALERQPSRALTAPGTTRAEREAAYAAREAAKDAERGLAVLPGEMAVDLSSPLRVAELARRREAMVDALERRSNRILTEPGTTRAEREAAYAAREAAKDAERGLAVLPGEVAIDMSSSLRAAEAARRREAMVDALERQPSRALTVPGTTRAEREAAYAAKEAAQDAERGLVPIPGRGVVDLSSPLRAAELARRREAVVDALEKQPSRSLTVPGTTRAEREAAYAASEAERGLAIVPGQGVRDVADSTSGVTAVLRSKIGATVEALTQQEGDLDDESRTAVRAVFQDLLTGDADTTQRHSGADTLPNQRRGARGFATDGRLALLVQRPLQRVPSLALLSSDGVLETVTVHGNDVSQLERPQVRDALASVVRGAVAWNGKRSALGEEVLATASRAANADSRFAPLVVMLYDAAGAAQRDALGRKLSGVRSRDVADAAVPIAEAVSVDAPRTAEAAAAVSALRMTEPHDAVTVGGISAAQTALPDGTRLVTWRGADDAVPAALLVRDDGGARLLVPRAARSVAGAFEANVPRLADALRAAARVEGSDADGAGHAALQALLGAPTVPPAIQTVARDVGVTRPYTVLEKVLYGTAAAVTAPFWVPALASMYIAGEGLARDRASKEPAAAAT